MHFMLVPEYISNHSQIYRILEGLQEVWDPQCIEEVMSVCIFFSVIPHQVNKVKYVILPIAMAPGYLLPPWSG
jgi:hypothetical protein